MANGEQVGSALRNICGGAPAVVGDADPTGKGVRRRRWRRRAVLASLALAAMPLLACAAFFAAVWCWPYPDQLAAPGPPATLLVDRHGVELVALAASDGQWRMPLTADEISPHLLAAIVAVEDGRFYQHAGVDWRAVLAAAWQDATHLQYLRGASTLTMQVQHLRDPQPRHLANKIAQAVRAYQIEKCQSKQAILVEYINRAPFGGNLIGAGAASWRYFGKPCADLSLGQAALLAGLPQSPNRLRPDRHPQQAAARRNHVLVGMLAMGMITAKEHDQAAAEPVEANWQPLPQSATPVVAANGAMPTLIGLADRHRQRDASTLHTTLDYATQLAAAAAAQQQLANLAPSGVNAVAVVVLDTKTAQVLASVSLISAVPGDPLSRSGNAALSPSPGTPGEASGFGDCPPAGWGEGLGAFNRLDLTRRDRSTGSVIKPLIYASAFDLGICTPQTTILDTPAAWSGYAPANFDRRFSGPMSVADALAQSRNIPAMLILWRVGVSRALTMMDGLGLHRLARSRRDYGLTLAVGGAEASPLEIAGAYATLARGGIVRPVSLVPDDATPSDVRIIRPESCWQTLASLSAADRTLHICPEAVALHPAWKTGTSSGRRDAWCAAVSPRKTVVVWFGNPANTGSQALVGQDAAAPLALKLLATLDASADPPPWQSAAFAAAGPSQADLVPLTPAPRKLALITPRPGQHFALCSDLPPNQQQILLQAAAPADSREKIWWFIDDQLLTTSAAGQQWWPPTPGHHQIRVLDETGHTATVDIAVDR